MSRDTLFLLEDQFADPGYPGDTFYCPDTLRLKGLLAAFPAQAKSLDVVVVPFAKPREAVVARLGPENQSLPVLVLAPDSPGDDAAGLAGATRFIASTRDLLGYLARHHGFPQPHP